MASRFFQFCTFSLVALQAWPAIAVSDFTAEQEAFLGDFAAEQQSFLEPEPEAIAQEQPVDSDPGQVEPYRPPEVAYQAPVYEEPVYQEPVYQAPSYQPPVYQEPVYQAPVEQESAYVPPARQVYAPPPEPKPLPKLTEPEGYRRVVVPAPPQAKVEDPPIRIEVPTDLKLLPIFDIAQMQYPLTLPGFITSIFGWRSHPITREQSYHTGIDIGAEHGTPVVAAFAGTVVHADWMGGYGKTVVIEHQGYRTLYAHLSEIKVRPGLVGQGMILGAVGSTGRSTGPHLHFELQKKQGNGWEAIDPGSHMKSALKTMMERAKQAVNSQPLPAMPLDNQQDQLAGQIFQVSKTGQ